MTPFGQYLEKKQISGLEASKTLDVTYAYIRMFILGTATPALKLAWRIEEWTEGKVKMQSWVPFLKEEKVIKRPRKKR